jgi:hypothetical protein
VRKLEANFFKSWRTSHVYDMNTNGENDRCLRRGVQEVEEGADASESFSSAIKRSLEARPKLSEIAGTPLLSLKDWTEIQKELAKTERKTLEKMERTA